MRDLLPGDAVGDPGHRFVSGVDHVLGNGRYQLTGGGVPPEPGLRFGFGILGPLGHAGLEEEGFQVVDAVPHILGQRHVLGTFFHIGLFALGKVLQEPDHTPKSPLGIPLKPTAVRPFPSSIQRS